MIVIGALNVERAEDAHVTGYVVVVEAEHLLALDAREGNYDRTLVTNEVTLEGNVAPGVVWTYVGKRSRTATARAAILRGTARIRREYLDNVVTAFEGQDEMLAELQATLAPPRAPIESLDRRTG